MMADMRLIDADALFKAIKTDKIAWRFGVPNTLKLMFDHLQIIIKEQPTIDAVPVVRCKDCRYCFFDLSGREYHLCMRVENNFPARKKRNADDFCSSGERKDDAR